MVNGNWMRLESDWSCPRWECKCSMCQDVSNLKTFEEPTVAKRWQPPDLLMPWRAHVSKDASMDYHALELILYYCLYNVTTMGSGVYEAALYIDKQRYILCTYIYIYIQILYIHTYNIQHTHTCVFSCICICSWSVMANTWSAHSFFIFDPDDFFESTRSFTCANCDVWNTKRVPSPQH